MISLSPLQLKSHVFPVINLRANPTGTHEGGINLDQHLVCVPVPNEKNQWQLEVFLHQKSIDAKKPFFYDIDIHVVGIIEVVGELPEKTRDQIVQVNGLALLYGAAREMVLNVTARSVFGPFCLPSINFLEALKHAKPSPKPPSSFAQA